MLKFIPNLLTLGNLFCGSISVILIVENQLTYVPLLIGIAAFLDFFDGFAARAFKVSGPLGKELDSLADMVSFGLVPGLIMYHYFMQMGIDKSYAYGGLILTLASCYRLAVFNISTNQSSEFIGVPTPATTLFFLSYPLLEYFNPEGYIFQLMMQFETAVIVTVIFTYLLNAKLPLIALKFKDFKLNGDNIFRYLLLAGIIILGIFSKWSALPLAILYYIALSTIRAIKNRKNLSIQ